MPLRIEARKRRIKSKSAMRKTEERMKIKAVILDPEDNVGIALMDLESGTELDLAASGLAIHVKSVEPISYQHKFSVTAHFAQFPAATSNRITGAVRTALGFVQQARVLLEFRIQSVLERSGEE